MGWHTGTPESFYNGNETSGIARYRAVIQDTSAAARVKYPTSQGCDGFIGITLEGTSEAGSIAVQVSGVAKGTAYGVIAIGDRLKIADTVGRVMSATQVTPAASYTIGRALTATTTTGDAVEFVIEKEIRTV